MRWCKNNPNVPRSSSIWYMYPSTGNRNDSIVIPQIALSHTYRGRFLFINFTTIPITKEQFHYYHQHPNEVYMECLL